MLEASKQHSSIINFVPKRKDNIPPVAFNYPDYQRSSND